MKNWWQATFPNGLQKLTITDSNGVPVNIAYGEKGTGKPIVLMHGWGVWSYSWTPVIDELSKQFRVVCFDYKGFGYSDKPTQSNAVGYQIEETVRVLEALGAKQTPVNLVAESLGTVVALAVAQRRPDLVAALVLLDAAIFPVRMPHWSMHTMIYTPLFFVRWFDQLRLIKWVAPLVRFLMRVGAGAIYHTVPADMAERTRYNLHPYVEFSSTLTYIFADSQSYAKEIRDFLRNKPSLLGDIQAKLHQIECPCLVVWGQEDRWFPVNDGKRLVQALPNARLVVEPNCGHHISGDCSSTIVKRICEFL